MAETVAGRTGRARTLAILITLILGAGALVAPAHAVDGPASGSTTSLRVRKSITALTLDERHAFRDAVLTLKKTRTPYLTLDCPDPSKWTGIGTPDCLSWYDTFVHWHVTLMDCDATDGDLHPRMLGHHGPMFMPWHREFLNLFEQALNAVSPTPIALPYWDWTDHSQATLDTLFSDDFMGPYGDPNDGYAVNGQFLNRSTWPLVVTNRHGAITTLTQTTDYLARTSPPTPADINTLPTMDDARTAFKAPHYAVPPYDDTSDPAQSFRTALDTSNGGGISSTSCPPDRPTYAGGTMSAGTQEHGRQTLHGPPHIFVGGMFTTTSRPPFTNRPVGDPNSPPNGVVIAGSMASLPSSPNDPIFFLHHANLDRFWAEYQQVRDPGYEPTDEAAFPFNAINDPMHPFSDYGITGPDPTKPITPADVLNTANQLGYTYTIPAGDDLLTPGKTPAPNDSSVTANQLPTISTTGTVPPLTPLAGVTPVICTLTAPLPKTGL